MVAYSFHAMFAGQIAALKKRQTVRAARKRHARPGEPLQLYQDQRTVHCRKLVEVDPICVRVQPIAIQVADLIDERIVSIAIDGKPLHRLHIEAFAIADGFAISQVGDWRMQLHGEPGTARWNMGHFWFERHGLGLFEGRLIEWEPA